MGNKTKNILVTIAVAAFAAGCSKKSSGGGTVADSSLNISGSLELVGNNASSSSLLNANTKMGTYARSKDKLNSFAISDYKVACATFEDIPKACGTAVGTDGSFSLKCDGFKSAPFGCFVFNTVSFKNYPITFNITTGDSTKESSSVNIGGNLSSVSIVLDTDTHLATAAATVSDPASLTEIAVDAGAVAAMDGTWHLAPKAWADVSSKYSAEDLVGIKMIACYKNYWQSCQQGGNNNNCSPSNAKTTCTNPNIDAGTAYAAMMQERLGNGMNIFFTTSTEDTRHYLNVWPSSASRAICGNVESGFSWKFSDGAGGKPDVNLDFSTSSGCQNGETPNNCLVRKTGASILTVIGQWFPFLKGDVDGTKSVPNSTVSCKYMYNLWGDFWNPSQSMIDACKSNNLCNSGSGDDMTKTRNYIMAGIYSGTDKTGDSVFAAGVFQPDANFSDSVVAVADATPGYGYRTFDSNGEHWNVLTNPTRTDIGGCLQWPDWAKCQGSAGACSGPQYPTIVAVGKDVINYGPNANASTDDNKWKCSFSEKRLLVPDSNGYINLNGQKYVEAQSFITVNADANHVKHESWSKICEVANGGDKLYQTYPFDMTTQQITDQAKQQQGGGSPEQKKGMYMQAIYESLANGNDGGGGESYFFTGSRSISCSQIKNGAVATGAALTWNEVQKAFDFSFGPWQTGQLIKCVMVGIHAKHGTGEIYETAYNTLLGQVGQGVLDSFAPNAQGEPLVFANLKANSCIPKFQMTHMCTTDGYCTPKVICDDYNAADGGCNSGAEPSSRMAHMNVEALPNSKFRFFNLENRFDVMFNPSTNSNLVCQRANYMSITTDDAMTASTTTLGMTFESSEVEINVSNPDQDCQGNTLGSQNKLEMPDPKMYTTFTKQ